MTDPLSPKQRSENMRRIRSTGTSPEMAVRKLAHRLGYRFRLHVRDLPGKPDLVFPRLRRAIQVHGCFWHFHKGCVDAHFPKSREDYWHPKLERNQQRDKSNLAALRRLGWKVLVIWECQTRDAKRLEARIHSFLSTG